MTDSKELDRQKLAEEIIQECDAIVEWNVAPKGQYFKSHTQALRDMGHWGVSCYGYVKFKKDGKIYTFRAGYRNLLKMLNDLDKAGHISISEARKIPKEDRCSKCYGKGFIPGYEHVHNGICFKCGGTGV